MDGKEVLILLYLFIIITLNLLLMPTGPITISSQD